MSKNIQSTPDQNTNVWAVNEYFDRDMHEKNAASIAMAMSQLDQDDPWQFTNRLLIEANKYESQNIKKLRKSLYTAFYGNSKMPDLEKTPIPLYYLKSDLQTDRNEVRIRGIFDSQKDKIIEYLPWSGWQKLKLESVQVIYDIGSKLIAEIDSINNFSPNLNKKISEIDKLVKEVNDNFTKIKVEEMIEYKYLKKDNNRNFTRERKDFMTFKRDSPDPANRKFKIFSRDYFYNLQMLISQVFNSNDYSESMLHLVRVSVFVSNKMYTKSKNRLFVITPRDPQIFSTFVSLVYKILMLNDLANNHQYFTADERIDLMNTLYEGKGVLMNAGTKIMSLINYILTIIPFTKSNNSWGTGTAE